MELNLFDLELRRLDNPIPVALLQRRDQRHRFAGATGAARAADAVNVRLDLVGHVVVDDPMDRLDIEPAGGDVGGDQGCDLFRLESLEHLEASVLVVISVQRSGGITSPPQRAIEFDHRAARVAEHDARLAGSAFEELDHEALFVVLPHPRELLSNVGTVEISLVVETVSGSRMKRFISVRIRGGIVAEKSSVWRSGGVRSRIDETSSIKPMSSIRSASSRIT